MTAVLNFNKTVDCVIVFDVLGKKVKSQNGPTKMVDLSSLNKGVYFIKARNTEQGEQMVKVVKRQKSACVIHLKTSDYWVCQKFDLAQIPLPFPRESLPAVGFEIGWQAGVSS